MTTNTTQRSLSATEKRKDFGVAFHVGTVTFREKRKEEISLKVSEGLT
jgi:hypothetical protein